MAEELEWIRLPQDIQHRFFELAENESRHIARTLRELRESLGELKRLIEPYLEPLPAHDEVIRVAAVDGSRSPRLSERLGVRYGAFTAGITFLRGQERRDVYYAGVFKRKQALSAERSRYFFDLLMVSAERKLALEALEEADLVIVDGAFYSFVYPVMRMKKEGLYREEEERIVRETFDRTQRLLRSGKAIAVIKRSHSRAIGGYLALNRRDIPLATLIDKLALSFIMPARSVFDYHRLIGDTPVPIYTHVARYAAQDKWPEDPLAKAEETAYEPFEVLGLERPEPKALRRLQVRAYAHLPPCEIEYPSSLDKHLLLRWLGQPDFFNEGTNLPIALDLIDNAIGLSVKFTDEFVSEVEGRVLELMKGEEGEDAVRYFFGLLNPQKPY
jgi:hypothetical protein